MEINTNTFFWTSLGILVAGSLYLIYEGYKVQKLFAESIVGKLIRILVVVLLIEIYSLGIVSYAFLVFSPQGLFVLLPIVFLWIVSLGFAIAGVIAAKRQVTTLIKK